MMQMESTNQEVSTEMLTSGIQMLRLSQKKKLCFSRAHYTCGQTEQIAMAVLLIREKTSRQ